MKPDNDRLGQGCEFSEQTRGIFAEYLRQNQSRLYGYIHSLVRNLHDTDDLFQQTTVILWKKFNHFDPTRSFFAWACGVARGEITNFLRAKDRQRLSFGEELTLLLAEAQETISAEEVDERREALGRCLETLKPVDRTLVESCYGEEEGGIRVVAEQLGRSTQSVHNSLRRIRRALFECIQRTLYRTSPNSLPEWIG